jgi:hypothetical protein
MYLDIIFNPVLGFLLIVNLVMLCYLIKLIFDFREDVKKIDAFLEHKNELNNNLKKYKS